MSKQQGAGTRKRQRAEQHKPPQSKKQKLNHQFSESDQLAKFWDNLSKIWLTKSALEELDIRTGKRLSCSVSQRQTTQAFLTKGNISYVLAESIKKFLDRSTPKTLKEIKRLARHGGPDLSDISAVCIEHAMFAL